MQKGLQLAIYENGFNVEDVYDMVNITRIRYRQIEVSGAGVIIATATVATLKIAGAASVAIAGYNRLKNIEIKRERRK